ncbi:MAG: hypothetical protein ACTSVI_15795 [Promethearchaeota archaeon]
MLSGSGKVTERELKPEDHVRLLNLEHRVMIRQMGEVRQELFDLKEKYESLLEEIQDKHIKKRKLDVNDFISLDGEHESPDLLRNAILYYETRDGCPFYGDTCREGLVNNCLGVWINMGSPCPYFMEKLTTIIQDKKEKK